MPGHMNALRYAGNRRGEPKITKVLGDEMAELEKEKPVSLQELMLTTLAMADAVTKLLIEKGVITDAEFKKKLLEERAVYQRILHPTTQ
jgi:glycerol-3-phosphate cytidylyltransferase-like family protein